METEALVQALRDPRAYPHPTGEVGFLRTHISLLFFAGERVYKVKQPVQLGFLDYGTLERRRHFCDEEVRLGRRLAPDVYLGVVPIAARPGGELRVGGEGEPLEWAVAMKRLPEDRMLNRLLERGEIDNEPIHALVELPADFHRRAATGEGVDEHGTHAAQSANAEENIEALQSMEGPPLAPAALLEFLAGRSREFLEEHRELFARRVREGRIREGHGDLHAGNVCFLESGPVAYDCIDFNRRFRCGGGARELAFLAMDLDLRGFAGFGGYLVHRYAERTGDPELQELQRHYKGYFAMVRAKVAAIGAAGDGVPEERRAELRREAKRYLLLAAGYELPPACILTCGPPASGKSWLVEQLAPLLRAAVLHSDVRRKLLAGVPVGRHPTEAFGEGLYSPAMKERTYDSLLARSLEELRAGRTVLVDATFSQATYRAPFVEAMAREGFPLFLCRVSATEEQARARLQEHADDETVRRLRAAFEPPDELPAGARLDVASGQGDPEDAGLALAERWMGQKL